MVRLSWMRAPVWIWNSLMVEPPLPMMEPAAGPGMSSLMMIESSSEP